MCLALRVTTQNACEHGHWTSPCAVQRPALVPNAALGKALQDVGKSARRKVARGMDGMQPRATPLADDCGLPSSAHSAANPSLSGNLQVCLSAANLPGERAQS